MVFCCTLYCTACVERSEMDSIDWLPSYPQQTKKLSSIPNSSNHRRPEPSCKELPSRSHYLTVLAPNLEPSWMLNLTSRLTKSTPLSFTTPKAAGLDVDQSFNPQVFFKKSGLKIHLILTQPRYWKSNTEVAQLKALSKQHPPASQLSIVKYFPRSTR